ncbi:putative PRO3-delta 1-pyrroline-5-carboxylate reductase [Tilletiaria anomala UBC 951]|uniref:Pyrroline-5-carboxylate reductase n=1 Tax=Tilletiaria anomala (strain ATCC 24038 / CBS 436.72 / UBC 951) TaxID=1037660 RepID=A0A066VT88_TILAU|nr:putative PRO3-delta 1-pyrroline-5-carboxylate reductase [Tilletiaria anomala UBC 951]KDN44917.1 putative PRO3-delta 1-pyrroline-5-carboxylate reductase [Tilletiaria anomala UBC 951]
MSGLTLGIIGCGTMGIAILSGVIDSQRKAAQAHANGPELSGNVSLASSMTEEDLRQQLPTRYIAGVNRPESAKRLRKLFDAEGYTDVKIVTSGNGGNIEAAQESDIVLLACKPHTVKEVLAQEGMKQALEGKLVCSICAGLRIEQIRAWVSPTTKVVRAMPNTPSKIREGMTVLTPLAPSPTSEQDKALLLSIFTAVGRARFLDEKHFDACTALAGSGPAFAMVFLEAMADGGVMMGLPRPEALELAAQTMQGAARMALQSGLHPAAIKDSVTTPGGCTIAGLLNLEDGRVRSTVARSIQAATEHAAGLGQK